MFDINNVPFWMFYWFKTCFRDLEHIFMDLEGHSVHHPNYHPDHHPDLDGPPQNCVIQKNGIWV